MKKFIVESDFWEIFPEAKIGIVVCKGINNTLKDDLLFGEMLSDAQIRAKEHLTEDEFSNNEVIKIWREAYRKFKTKKGVRSSIESLLKRVNGDNGVGNINPLVDIYNSISLRYAMPCGGEDLDVVSGDILLTKATGDENFIVLGSTESTPPYEGEIVYKDDEGAICRCLNWRESARTMLTENTKNAFMVIEQIDGSRLSELENALENLKTLIQIHLGGNCEVHILDCNLKEINIDIITDL